MAKFRVESSDPPLTQAGLQSREAPKRRGGCLTVAPSARQNAWHTTNDQVKNRGRETGQMSVK